MGSFLLLAATLVPAGAAGARGRPSATEDREEGVFRILLSGSEIGRERFTIVRSGDSVTSSSTVEFLMPPPSRQKVLLESKLEMDSRYLPKSYALKSEVDGRKGLVRGVFTPGEAMFEYGSETGSRRRGLLTGDLFTLLDTNIFHHFVFLVRLAGLEPGPAEQRFEVVIPQEADSGKVRVAAAGNESIEVGGKRFEARRLRLDSGTLMVDLWVDARGLLRKIAVPEKKIEVTRAGK